MERNQFPVVLKAEHISQIIGCSKRIAYEMMEENNFPLIRIGRLKRVNREAFFKWLDEKEKKIG